MELMRNIIRAVERLPLKCVVATLAVIAIFAGGCGDDDVTNCPPLVTMYHEG